MTVQITYSKEQILQILQENSQNLKRFGVAKLGLFGSYARGEQALDSDMDFYVEFEEGQKSFDNLMDLAFYLEDQFGHKVDLLTNKSVSDWLRSVMEKDIEYVELHS
ncbi:MAG: nucleotidyltransferase family protein [Balneolaceae bacterium]